MPVHLPQREVERVAAAVVEMMEARARRSRGSDGEGYLAPGAAADYLGVSRKRVHDLTSMGALVPDGRDGRTPLFTRETLDRYVREGA